MFGVRAQSAGGFDVYEGLHAKGGFPSPLCISPMRIDSLLRRFVYSLMCPALPDTLNWLRRGEKNHLPLSFLLFVG